MQSFSQFTETLRASITRRKLEHQLMQVAARLPYEPECRCTYQHLLEEHLRLAGNEKPQAARENERC